MTYSSHTAAGTAIAIGQGRHLHGPLRGRMAAPLKSPSAEPATNKTLGHTADGARREIIGTVTCSAEPPNDATAELGKPRLPRSPSPAAVIVIGSARGAPEPVQIGGVLARQAREARQDPDHAVGHAVDRPPPADRCVRRPSESIRHMGKVSDW